MTFDDLKKYNFRIIDKQTGYTLSDDDEFFLDKNMVLYIKDVAKDGTVKINKANSNLYKIVLEAK